MERGRKKQRKEGQSGSVTVFLSMILICIISLMCGLLHSAALAGSGWYLQSAMNSSLDSLMSKYHRDVWEDYHLLLLETDGQEALSKEFSEYLNQYLESDAVYGLKPEHTQILNLTFVTDDKGAPLEEEILDYMKFGIFSELGDESSLSELKEVFISADGIHEVKKAYELHAKQAFRLEEALEDIRNSLIKQSEYLEQCRQALNSCRGHEFMKTAEKMAGEMERMPALREKYEIAAELLEKELDQSEKEAEKKREEIGEASWKALKSQMDVYRSYTDEEGERKKEVIRILNQTEENRRITENALARAEDIQEYIDSWEADDDEDELDEEELWDNVLDILDACRIPETSGQTGQTDKKRLGILEKISRMADMDLLDFVMPDGEQVSDRKMSMEELPSGKKEGYHVGISSVAPEELINRAVINEYIEAHFLRYAAKNEGETKTYEKPAAVNGKETDKAGQLMYEQEYILNGRAADRDNLTRTVTKLLAVREGMNLIHILGDSQKRQEARALAMALMGAASITPLADITAFFIMGVWAFAESVEDVRSLLKGEKVPLIKAREDWKLDLDEIFNFVDNQEKISGSGGKEGLSYRQYLKGFFLVQEKEERNGRIMDLIQYNLSGVQTSFRMSRCAVGAEAECIAKGKNGVIRKKAGKRY